MMEEQNTNYETILQTNKQKKSNLNQTELLDPIEKSEEHGKHQPRLLPHTIHKSSKGIIKLNIRAKISKRKKKRRKCF